ncbi:MAG: recombinase family protein [Patescibacteria group bacterium]
MEQTNLKYCLYARKSSESDERQAMSIDSQIKEMLDLAEKDKLNVVDIKRESHSAKNSGTRPLFLKMIDELNQGVFNSILTWAPDRLSRNAGDLGSLVDLMDKCKLLHIRTSSQSFSNNPNEKFLLMILCSQAKLENDNRGINVKRGIRAKCEMGWRPAPAPIGYLNYSHAGVKKVMPDPNAFSIIKEMFTLVANAGYSGRSIKLWLDNDAKLRTQKGKCLTLSMIYRMLKSSFYYGEFEYPSGSGIFYHGAHEPVISKMIFDRVQEKLTVPPKSKWGNKQFDLKGLFKCAYCGSSITAEERFKLLQNGSRRRYVYYHCTKQYDYDCPEPYIEEESLVEELINYVTFLERKNPKAIIISPEVKKEMKKYSILRDNILITQKLTPIKLTFTEYAKHVLYEGMVEEKQQTIKTLGFPLYIHNKNIYSVPLG